MGDIFGVHIRTLIMMCKVTT